MKITTPGQIAGAAIIFLLITAFVSCSQGVNQAYYEPLSMIPAPAATEAAAGEFLLRSGTGISIDPAFESSGEVADMFNAFLKKHYGKIRVSEQQNQGDANVIWARHDT